MIKLLKTAIKIENFLCIYRNYYDYSSIQKCFLFLHLCAQMSLLIAVSIIDSNLFYTMFTIENTIPFVLMICFRNLSFVNCFLFMFRGLYLNESFKSYVISIYYIYAYFKHKIQCVRFLRQLNIFFIVFVIIVLIYSAIDIIGHHVWTSSGDYWLDLLVIVIKTSAAVVYSIEDLIFFTMCLFIYLLMKCLGLSMSDVLKKLKSRSSSGTTRHHITKEMINKWSDIYEHLVICSKGLSMCFGKQMFLSLALSVIHFVYIMYQLIRSIVVHEENMYFGVRKMLIMVICYFVTILLMTLGGQLVQNQAVKLYRTTAALYNTSMIDPEEPEPKMVRDFLRLIKRSPVEIKLLTTMPLGLYMIPIVLTVVINYIIVLLQFNHIV